jgi:hypothetical protein
MSRIAAFATSVLVVAAIVSNLPLLVGGGEATAGGGRLARQWTKTLAPNLRASVQDVTTAPDGSIFIVGHTLDQRGIADIFAARYNEAGRQLWFKKLAGPENEFGRAAAAGPDGSLYVVGHGSGKIAGQQAKSLDLVVAKFTKSGALAWAKLLGGTAVERGFGVAVQDDGTIVVLGDASSPRVAGKKTQGIKDVLLARYNESGRRLKVAVFGGPGNESAVDLSLVEDQVVSLHSSESPNAGNQSVYRRTFLDRISLAVNNSSTLATDPQLSLAALVLDGFLAGSFGDETTGTAQAAFANVISGVNVSTYGPGEGNDIAAKLPGDDGGAGTAVDTLYIAASSRKPAGHSDALLLAVQPNGKVRQRLALGGPGNQVFESVAVGRDGSVYAAGLKTDRPMLVKYSP